MGGGAVVYESKEDIPNLSIEIVSDMRCSALRGADKALLNVMFAFI